MKIFTSKSTDKHKDDFVLAIGGGATIDEAKIYAKKNKKYLIAVPTTASGASETTHAVVWGKRTKQNVKTDKPLTVRPPFKVRLSREARQDTRFDCLGHLVDYLNVCTDNELIEVGIYMGKLIEQHPTNLTHPRSYPLTLKHGLTHGAAIREVIKDCLDEL